MKNLKIVNQDQLKDWAENLFKKNSFNMVDVSAKKETFRRALASGKIYVGEKVFTDYLNNNDWIIQTLGRNAGPSKNYINPSYKGKFGVIAPYSKDFCKSCNRLRITARGDLRLCLFGTTGISIRHLLQRDDQLEELKDLISKQLNFKKESHYLELGETGLMKNLSTTGG